MSENVNKNKELQVQLTGSRRYVKLIPLFFFCSMFIYVFLVTRAAGGVIPLCVFHGVTGYDCPGCGLTRASTHLLHGEFLRSLSFHPGGVLFVTWLSVVTLFQTTEFVLGREISLPQILRTTYHSFVRVALLVTVTYGVVRLILELMGVTQPLP